MDNFLLGMVTGIFIGITLGLFIMSCLVDGKNE